MTDYFIFAVDALTNRNTGYILQFQLEDIFYNEDRNFRLKKLLNYIFTQQELP